MNIVSEEYKKNRFIADKNEYEFIVNGKKENIVVELEKRKEDELSSAMEKYMPIGSIVKIKKSFQNYMVVGFNCSDNNTVFDYLACEYPFGLSLSHTTSMFNHDEIEKIFHIGFVNNQEKQFKMMLNGKCNNSSEIER